MNGPVLFLKVVGKQFNNKDKLELLERRLARHTKFERSSKEDRVSSPPLSQHIMPLQKLSFLTSTLCPARNEHSSKSNAKNCDDDEFCNEHSHDCAESCEDLRAPRSREAAARVSVEPGCAAEQVLVRAA